MKYFLLFLLGLSTAAEAHMVSEAFLTIDLEASSISGQLDIALPDMALHFSPDSNFDGKITWDELLKIQPEIQTALNQHLAIMKNGQPCPLGAPTLAMTDRTDGTFLSAIFSTKCADMAELKSLDVTYSLFHDKDPEHRAVTVFQIGNDRYPYTLNRQRPSFHFDPNDLNTWPQAKSFILQGWHHIFAGLDHILFITALMLAAIYYKKKKRLMLQPSLKIVLIDCLKLTTAFTIAHATSLTIVTYHLFSPPAPRYTEMAVAATILFTAVDNLTFTFKKYRWQWSFLFGLVHGLGYASSLQDLALSAGRQAIALLGFNVGVELAHFVIVMIAVPVGYFMGRYVWYKWLVFYGGSLAVAILATMWFLQQLLQRNFGI